MVKILKQSLKLQATSELYSKADEILSEFLKEVEKEKAVSAVFLYGSYAAGKAGEKSDIDLFILSSASKEKAGKLEAKLNKAAAGLAIRRSKKFNHLFRIECLAGSLREQINPELLKNIIRQGKIIFSRGMVLCPWESFNLNHYLIFSLDMSRMKASQKVKISLLLYGRTSSYKYKGKKTTKKYEGILKQVNAEVLAPGCFLVPKKHESRFEYFLNAGNVPFSKREILEI